MVNIPSDKYRVIGFYLLWLTGRQSAFPCKCYVHSITCKMFYKDGQLIREYKITDRDATGTLCCGQGKIMYVIGILKYMFHNLKIINFISSDNGTLAKLLYPLDSRWSAMEHQLI